LPGECDGGLPVFPAELLDIEVLVDRFGRTKHRLTQRAQAFVY
jgi:hypothetical protein